MHSFFAEPSRPLSLMHGITEDVEEISVRTDSSASRSWFCRRQLPGRRSVGLRANRARIAPTPTEGILHLPGRSPDERSKAPSSEPRLCLIIETDAGGDPDDEQSLVRFLLYVQTDSGCALNGSTIPNRAHIAARFKSREPAPPSPPCMS